MKASIGISIALFATFMTFVPKAHAQATHGESYKYVTKVNVGADNKLWINVGNLTAAHGCSTPWYAVSAYTLADDRTRAWLQISLASLLSHTPVYVETTGCTGGSGIGYPILTKLQIQQD
jgi:hypothetical protein